jgi:hypothetical protein
MTDNGLYSLKNCINQAKNIISPEESIFLYTIFQYYLEKAVEMINSDDKIKRDKAQILLNSLLENSFLQHFRSNRVISACIRGLLNFYIGLLKFNDEEQSSCESPFLKALDNFNTLPIVVKIRYINIYQEIYNNLGIVFYNRGDIKKGLQFLGKAEQIYKVFSDLSGYNITNSFPRFMIGCSRGERTGEASFNSDTFTPPDSEFFNFYIDGGINKKNFEHNYTLTIFYYAQAFTKLGFRKKAIKYCSLTLKRQIETDEYDLKDTIVNCINLSEFYTENQHYAQTEYILISAMSLIPEGKKKRLKASLNIQLGKYFLDRLKFAVKQTRECLWISESEELYSIVNRRIFTFSNLNILWPKIDDIRDLEQAKVLFRLANTQYKKALEYFVLDGYVSENITINKDISQLYKHLTFFETDNNRIYAMLDRRIALLEPIVKAINEKIFILQWQELSLELAEIYSEIFESKYELLRIKGEKKISYEPCEKAIFYYYSVLNFILKEYEKAQEKTLDDFSTIITIKLHLARLYSKSGKENPERVNSLVKSLKVYEETYKLIKTSPFIKNGSANPSLMEQYNICEEMINLLPVKIGKVNRGEEIF